MAHTNNYIIQRRDQKIEDVVIESYGLTIGRLQGNDLVLNNREVSATHAGIKEISGDYWIFNLSSSHSTVLNGKVIDQARIRNRDVAEIRPYLLRFEKSQDGLRITVEIEADSTVGEDKFVTGKLTLPSTTGKLTRPIVTGKLTPTSSLTPKIDEHTLKVYWEKRKREAGKVSEKTPLSPRGERKMGKAQFNWIPTLDLKQPWRRSYFILCGLVVTACSLAALIGYSQAFSPGRTASAHSTVSAKSSKIG